MPTVGGGVFRIDPQNGSLFLMASPDRETTPLLQAKIKVNPIHKRPRKIAQIIYPVYPDDLGISSIIIYSARPKLEHDLNLYHLLFIHSP